MSEEPENKVVSLFSGKAIGPEHVGDTPRLAVASKAAKIAKVPDGVDQKAVQTLNTVIEDVLTGKTHGVCIIATNPQGLGRFYLSFGEGVDPQVESTRYLGLTHLFQTILENIVHNGVDMDGE